MSVKVSSYIWEHSAHRGTSKLVLLALADFANDSGICWPSAATIAARVNESERNVRQIIKSLVASGDLITTPGGGRGHTTRYGIAVGLTDRQREKLNSVLQNTVSTNTDMSETVKSGDINSDLQRIKTVKSGDLSEGHFEAPASAETTQNEGGIHHGSVMDPSRDRAKAAKAASRTPKKQPEKTPAEQAYLDRKKAIESAYVEALGYKPASFGKEAKAAKWLAEQNYTADQVLGCLKHLRVDEFYAGKHISLQTIANQIGAWAMAQKNRKPILAPAPATPRPIERPPQQSQQAVAGGLLEKLRARNAAS